MKSGKVKNKAYRKWLFKHLYKQKYLVILVLIGIFVVSLTLTLVPLIVGQIIDNVLITRDLANLLILLVIALTVSLLYNLSDYSVMMLGHFLGLKIEQNMRQEFFETIQLKTLSFHDNVRTGDLLAFATNDVRVINTMVAHGSFFIYPFVQIFITLYFLVEILDYRLALFSLPFIILYFYFILYYRKRLAPYVTNRMKMYSNLAVVLQDSISGAYVVRAFNAERLERKKFGRSVIAYKNNIIGQNIVQARYYALLILYLLIGSTLLISCFFAYQNTLTVGEPSCY